MEWWIVFRLYLWTTSCEKQIIIEYFDLLFESFSGKLQMIYFQLYPIVHRKLSQINMFDRIINVGHRKCQKVALTSCALSLHPFHHFLNLSQNYWNIKIQFTVIVVLLISPLASSQKVREPKLLWNLDAMLNKAALRFHCNLWLFSFNILNSLHQTRSQMKLWPSAATSIKRSLMGKCTL